MADLSVEETIDYLAKTIDEMTSMSKPSPSGRAKMKLSEVGTTADPLRNIEWPVADGALPKGSTVFSAYDPMKDIHRVTLDLGTRGPQYHIDVTSQVLSNAKDVSAITSGIVATLLTDAGYGKDEAKYKAITLSWWKWCVAETVSKHMNETGDEPKHIFLSQRVYDYIIDCEDDLSNPSSRRMGTAKKVEAVIPKGILWRTEAPKEANDIRYIRVR